MSEQKSFENEWRRLLKISPRSADVFRREHNREVMLRELYGHYWEFPVEVVYEEEVVCMENGKATAVRSRMRE